MKQRFLLLAIAVIHFTNSNAQFKYKANYVPATVWFANGDSVKGFLDFQEWTLSPKEIFFKKNSTEEPKAYSPVQVAAFEVMDGERWISYSGYLDQRAANDDRLGDQPYADSAYTILFIRVLYEGKKNLYYVRDDQTIDHLLYSDGHDSIREFHVNRYIKYLIDPADPTNISKYIVENRAYREQLNDLLGDCRKMDAKLKYANTTYNQGDFLKLFQQYNECTESKPVYEGKKDVWRFIPTVNTGVNFSTLHVNYADPLYGVDSTYNNTSVSFGIGLDCILPRNLGHWSIYNEFFVRANDYGTFSNGTEGFDLNYVYLKLGTMLRYYSFYSSGKFYPEIGMSNGINVRQNVPKDETQLGVTSGDYEQGLLLGAGTIWHNINVEARFEIAKIYSPASFFSSNSRTFYVVAGYYFK